MLIRSLIASAAVLAAVAVVTALGQNPPAAPQPGAYRLQPGDEIQVQVFDIQELNATVRIPPDGMINLLLLDEIKAGGLTVPGLRDLIAEGYSRRYKNPRVSVTIRSYDNLKVYVTGHVAKPGAMNLVKGLTAVQAITQAGGLMENAKADEAVILRQTGAETPQVIKLHIKQVLEHGRADIPLQAADVVYIPRTDYKVFVGGEVLKPGLVSMDTTLTAMAAVFQAGGLTQDASPKDALVLRDSGNNTAQVLRVNLKQTLAGGQDAVLKPFDVVYVPKSGIAKLNLAVDQYVRRVIPFSLSAGFSYLLGGSFIGF